MEQSRSAPNTLPPPVSHSATAPKVASPATIDHDTIATAVFSRPPIGAVGLGEGEARKALGQIDVCRAVFRPMKVALYGGEERTLMKLLVRADAPEMIQMAAIAVKMGVTKQQWDSTCAVHPTAAEELVTMREKYLPADLGAVG